MQHRTQPNTPRPSIHQYEAHALAHRLASYAIQVIAVLNATGTPENAVSTQEIERAFMQRVNPVNFGAASVKRYWADRN